jgi:hypothetical protein
MPSRCIKRWNGNERNHGMTDVIVTAGLSKRFEKIEAYTFTPIIFAKKIKRPIAEILPVSLGS